MVGVLFIFTAWQQFMGSNRQLIERIGLTPTLPERLTSRGVLPTLTPVPGAPIRQLIFASAHIEAPIVPAVCNGASWELRYLAESVGSFQHARCVNVPAGKLVL